METYQLVLRSEDGEQIVAYNVLPCDRYVTLKRARRILFGKRGRISYRDWLATCEGATLEIVPQ